MDLMKSHTVSVTRRILDGGYIDDNGNYVEGGNSSIFLLECNLQPYKESKGQKVSMDGIKTMDSRIIRSFVKLYTSDEYENRNSDLVTYKNRLYEVFYEFDWTGFGLETDHYKYIIVAQDKV